MPGSLQVREGTQGRGEAEQREDAYFMEMVMRSSFSREVSEDDHDQARSIVAQLHVDAAQEALSRGDEATAATELAIAQHALLDPGGAVVTGTPPVADRPLSEEDWETYLGTL